MKKFLSLVLALIMTMSLVTVSAGAKDFTDDESLNYEEAVAVMSEIGVIDGYTDGSFKPQNGLTRGAAAKIICNMILGPTTASALRADTAPFKDVAVDNQYAGYIAYCVQQGITSGYTDGTYRPAAPLTNFAFMKMLLGALGYDQNTEGYVGGNCFINVAKQAIGIGLNAGLLEEFDGGKQITREEAALFAFNTLKATMVEYDQKTVVTVGNAEVALSGNLRDVVNSAKTETIKDDNKMQFAEKYFGKLSLEADKQDVYGRPANTWTNGKEDIGTYVDYTELVKTYTDSVSAKELYDLLGKTVVEDYAITVYVDGIEQPISVVNEIAKTNKTDFSTSGRGVKTEVFVDKDHEEVIITSINTYLAIATADYSTKAETATFEIYAVKKVDGEFVKVGSACKKASDDKVTGVKVSNDDIVVEDIKKDDVVLVTVAEGAIQTIDEPEVIEDVTITAFSKHSKVIADGETYKYCDTVEYNKEVLDDYDQNNMKEKTYNIFLDPYGNLIGLEYVKVDDNYVFITGIDTPNNTYLDNGTYKVRGIFLDGTTAVFEAKAKSGTTLTPKSQENKWYTYTVSKDVYTLSLVDTEWANGDKVAQSYVDDATSVTIDYKHPSLKMEQGAKTYVYGNNDTVYLTAKLGKVLNGQGKNDVVINGVAAVTTGIKNTSIVTYAGDAEKAIAKADGAELTGAAYVLFKSNGYIIGAVVVGEDGAVSKNLVYVNSGSPSLEGYNSSDDEWTWTREVILNGEKTELTEVGSELTYLEAGTTDKDTGARNGMFEDAWYVVSFDAKGNVTGISEVVADTASIEYVPDFANGAIQDAIDTGKDTVLYEEDDATFENVVEDNLPKLIEQTLYLSNSDTDGFYIAEDVKVVLIQKNYGKKTTTYDVGPAAIEAAIESLNADAVGKYTFEMNAVIERGAAQVVIIKDTVNGVAGTGNKTETDGEIAVKDVTSADLKDTAFEGATSYIAKGLKGEMVDDVLVVTGTIGKGYEFTGTSTTNVPGFGVMGNYFTVDSTPKTTGNGSSKIAIIPITADGEIYLWLIGDATETFTITETVDGKTVTVATVNVKNVVWA